MKTYTNHLRCTSVYLHFWNCPWPTERSIALLFSDQRVDFCLWYLQSSKKKKNILPRNFVKCSSNCYKNLYTFSWQGRIRYKTGILFLRLYRTMLYKSINFLVVFCLPHHHRPFFTILNILCVESFMKNLDTWKEGTLFKITNRKISINVRKAIKILSYQKLGSLERILRHFYDRFSVLKSRRRNYSLRNAFHGKKSIHIFLIFRKLQH